MKTVYLVGIVAILTSVSYAAGQTPSLSLDSDGPGLLSCSPAPCVLPPTQASEGGAEVTDAPIVANPMNPKQLLLGSSDFNCPSPSVLGFHYSNDGGSTWTVTCMPTIITTQHVYWPTSDPSVGYDGNGTAYIAGDYFDSEGLGYGLVGLQKSSDGINWSDPVEALIEPLSYPAYNALAVDTNVGSPYLNTIYVSAVLIGPPDDNSKNRVVVSHSPDGGTSWSRSAADPTQTAPAEDNFTAMSVGSDGTVYLTWLHCLGHGPGAHCDDGKAYMVISKSIDGGDTWSTPSLVAAVTMPHDWTLPNSNVRVYNYPVIGVDNSNGPYAGNLYVVMYTWTGSYMRVQVIHSSDGGSSWSKPVRVAPASETHDQFFPWLSVSPTGLVGVSWLDRRNDPANIDYQAFAAISTDGGQSFQPNIQLTEAFSNPNVNGYSGNGWMGDYTGNTWDGSTFVAAWMDSSNGVDMQEVVGGIRLK